MKISVILLLVLAVTAFVLFGCEDLGPRMSDPSYFTWSKLKSPQTGFCYEVATRKTTNKFSNPTGYMSMSRIPCDVEGVSQPQNN